MTPPLLCDWTLSYYNVGAKYWDLTVRCSFHSELDHVETACLMWGLFATPLSPSALPCRAVERLIGTFCLLCLGRQGSDELLLFFTDRGAHFTSSRNIAQLSLALEHCRRGRGSPMDSRSFQKLWTPTRCQGLDNFKLGCLRALRDTLVALWASKKEQLPGVRLPGFESQLLSFTAVRLWELNSSVFCSGKKGCMNNLPNGTVEHVK